MGVTEVRTQVSFQLDRLSARNGHHEFEHLCRDLARVEIARNILPATGPVSSGGDQGRDFETFRTFLGSGDLSGRSFVAVESDKAIVFTCSIQRSRIPEKVRGDLTSIMSCGTAVEAVYFFSNQPIPVSTRHELQEWARNEHSVVLEILDGEAISELLSTRDRFWITQEHLGIPAEVYPDPPSSPDDSRYLSMREQYRDATKWVPTFSCFNDIKSGLRHSDFESQYRHDVGFWSGLMKRFLEDGDVGVLRYRAIYELAVVSVRAGLELKKYDDLVREYFDAIRDRGLGQNFFSDIEDAVSLLIYYSIAAADGRTSISSSDIEAWHTSLVNQLKSALARETSVAYRCQLLFTLGRLAMSTYRPSLSFDYSRAMPDWLALAELLDLAPLFPVERLADQLNLAIELSDYIEEPPQLMPLLDKVEAHLAQRIGRASVAEKAEARARTYQKQGRLLLAITQLHRAKVEWFSRETLAESIRSMMLIARCYRELGLLYASKYYLLAAAWLAIESDDVRLMRAAAHATAEVADAEYFSGNFLTFLGLAKTAVHMHLDFVPDRGMGDLSDPHSFWNRMMGYSALIHCLAGRLDDDLFEYVEQLEDATGLSVHLGEFIEEIESTWASREVDDILDQFIDQLEGLPFNDAYTSRLATWKALGTDWSVEWHNDAASTPVAEELLGLLQVITAEFARFDFHIIGSSIRVRVRVNDVQEAQIVEDASSPGNAWIVTLPANPHNNVDSYRSSLIAIASQMFSELSTLKSDEFFNEVEAVFKDGLSAKVIVVNSYAKLYRDIYGPENELQHPHVLADSPRPGIDTEKVEHLELLPRSGVSPRYSRATSEEAIQRRYDRIPGRIPVTLSRLSADTGFAQTVFELRREGWKDWHLLLAVANIAMNDHRRHFYPDHKLPFMSREEIERLMDSAIDRHQAETARAVPVEAFTTDRMREFLGLAAMSSLLTFDLELRGRVYKKGAVLDFLGDRFCYWDDDVSHSDPFAPPPSQGLILPTGISSSR